MSSKVSGAGPPDTGANSGGAVPLALGSSGEGTETSIWGAGTGTWAVSPSTDGSPVGIFSGAGATARGMGGTKMTAEAVGCLEITAGEGAMLGRAAGVVALVGTAAFGGLAIRPGVATTVALFEGGGGGLDDGGGGPWTAEAGLVAAFGGGDWLVGAEAAELFAPGVDGGE